MKPNTIKIISAIVSGVSVVATIVGAFMNDKMVDLRINEGVQKALANAETVTKGES